MHREIKEDVKGNRQPLGETAVVVHTAVLRALLSSFPPEGEGDLRSWLHSFLTLRWCVSAFPVSCWLTGLAEN